MNICEFSRKMLQARTLTEAGLYEIEATTMKKILQSLGVRLEKTNDRKKLSNMMITYVRQKCNCLVDIQKSKHFMVA